MGADRGMLERIAGAKASAGGNIIKDGKYVWAIKQLLLDKKFKGNCFIAEMLCKQAEKVEPDVEPNPVGTTASYVVNLDNTNAPSSLGNVKAFILGLFGYREEDVTQEQFVEVLEKILDKGQMARGMLIKDETYRKPIRSGANAGKPFTAHRWSAVEQSAEQIASERAAIDAFEKNSAAAR